MCFKVVGYCFFNTISGTLLRKGIFIYKISVGNPSLMYAELREMRKLSILISSSAKLKYFPKLNKHKHITRDDKKLLSSFQDRMMKLMCKIPVMNEKKN
jgi:hypothetical protein